MLHGAGIGLYEQQKKKRATSEEMALVLGATLSAGSK